MEDDGDVIKLALVGLGGPKRKVVRSYPVWSLYEMMTHVLLNLQNFMYVVSM